MNGPSTTLVKEVKSANAFILAKLWLAVCLPRLEVSRNLSGSKLLFVNCEPSELARPVIICHGRGAKDQLTRAAPGCKPKWR